jgi:integrase
VAGACPSSSDLRGHAFAPHSGRSWQLNKWWYRCLQRAGIVAAGVTRGRKMHMARHTAGQAVLDKTGNLKAVQKLLGHSSITTTADIYTDWDIDQLAETMREVLDEAEK